MALMTSDAKLFGLDLSALARQWQEVWPQVMDWAVFRRLMPVSGVEVLGHKSGAWVRAGRWLRWQEAGQDGALSAAAIVLVDEGEVLSRSLRLPVMPTTAMQGAVALDVQTMSPFSALDTVWGHVRRQAPDATGETGHSQGLVDVVIVSRAHIEKLLKEFADHPTLAKAGEPEVWAMSTSGTPILLPGFGEQRRLKKEAWRWRWLMLGLGGVLALALAVAVTPSLQLRFQALDAQRQLTQLSRSVSDVVAARQALAEGGQDVATLLDRQRQQLDHLRVLAALTASLPDDTAVQRIQFKGSKLMLLGLSGNVSRAVDLLSKVPGFVEVQLPSAVTRAAGTNKDSFALEAIIDPKVFGAQASEPEPEAAQSAQAQEPQAAVPSAAAKEGQ
ncbi:PilN domain-containing protein [Delftia acidovorans]|uniref:PilN domain-containing protein n=1 Tax=Delftia acidovorans TaxID=80866 RepID=UPI00241CF42B|nr:PilN domain-containing protein [Delftia acidovorans]